VLAALPPELRVAMVLAVCTALRESDVLSFPWSNYRDGKIQGRAQKTGEPIWMPAHPMLAELLAATPRRSPIIVVGARGKPYTQSGFRARFFRVIRELREAGKIEPGLTFHGLRTTTATMLHEAGCDMQTIMAITGHKTEAMVRIYTEEADRNRRATAAIAKLDFGARQNKARS
jgi:integrase